MQPELAVFHAFDPPPSGGGHQFMRALCAEFERRRYRLSMNRLAKGAEACLFNSFNFDFARLRRGRSSRPCRMVHRVDGPLAVYRGFDDGTDARIQAINAELADATVLQSRFSLRAHAALGLTFKDPIVIMNAADPSIFHDRERPAFNRDRRVRLISVSWSDNPNKGGAVYAWLDRRLDWTRFEYTFAGRTRERFEHIRHVAPVSTDGVADLLRGSDIYITASRNDPCSNSLVEALSCGLPCLYLNSGGHAEIAGEAGLPFDEAGDIPALLERLVDEYEARRAAVNLPTIAGVADQYLDVLLPGRSGQDALR